MNVDLVRVGDVLRLERRTVEVDLGARYREVGVRSFGRGLFLKDPLTGADLGAKRVFHMEPGDLVVSSIFAWEGAVAVAGERYRDTIGSHRFMTWVASTEDVDLAYLAHYFVSEPGLTQVRQASPGSAGRNRTLSISGFERIEVPLPDISEQRRIATHLDSIESVVVRTPLSQAAPLEKAALTALLSTEGPLQELGTVAAISRGVTPELRPGGPGLIGQAAVRWNGVDRSRLKGVEPDWEESKGPEQRTRVGDLLLNSTGEGTIGRCGLVGRESMGLLTDSKVLSIRTGADLDPRFLALFLRSPRGRAAVEGAKGANTTKQTELGVRRCSNLRVPVPVLADQVQIVESWERAIEPLIGLSHAEERRNHLLSALLPAARNEIFSSMR